MFEKYTVRELIVGFWPYVSVAIDTAVIHLLPGKLWLDLQALPLLAPAKYNRHQHDGHSGVVLLIQCPLFLPRCKESG